MQATLGQAHSSQNVSIIIAAYAFFIVSCTKLNASLLPVLVVAPLPPPPPPPPPPPMNPNPACWPCACAGIAAPMFIPAKTHGVNKGRRRAKGKRHWSRR